MNHLRTIYMDNDGVNAGFQEHFLACFGVPCDSMTDAEMWKKVHTNLNFFRELPILPGAAEFFERLYGEYMAGSFNLAILTACPKDHYVEHSLAKKLWIAENLAENIQVMPVHGGNAKPLFMRKPGDILIDDYSHNIRHWNAAGGIGILHTNFDATLMHLQAMGYRLQKPSGVKK